MHPLVSSARGLLSLFLFSGAGFGASALAQGFTNFDFEQGTIGWTVTSGGGGLVGGVQGTSAWQTQGTIVGYGTSTLVSDPFTITAGTKIWSAQILGGAWSDLYVSLVNAGTGQEIARLRRSSEGNDWQLCTARLGFSADTLAYIKIVDAFNPNSMGGIAVDDIRVDSQASGTTNLDFEQGYTAWTVVGYGTQVESYMSKPTVMAAQGARAYQTARGTGVISASEQALTSEAYSGVFTLTPGIKLFSADLYGGSNASLYVALHSAATGAELCRLVRFTAGEVWERCHATIAVSTATPVFVKIVDRSATGHLGVDAISVTDFTQSFDNFGFEQGWVGWTRTTSDGFISGTAREGTRAFQSHGDIFSGHGTSRIISAPFTATAGRKVFSAHIRGGAWGELYVSLVNATTGAELARVRRDREGSDWALCTARVNLAADTLVYLAVVDNFQPNAVGGIAVDDIRLDTLSTGAANLDFEQGYTGWTVVGYGTQVESFMSNPYVGPAQGMKAYQTARGSGVISSDEQAQTSEAYSAVFAVPAGIKLFSADLYATLSESTYVALVSADTGAELCRLNRFGGGLNWERCHATIALGSATNVFVKIVDQNGSAHLGVDNIAVTAYTGFDNFGFEQGWVGWFKVQSGGHIQGTAGEGSLAYMTRGSIGGYGNSVLMSAPFTVPAGVNPFSALIYGGGWSELYVSLIEAGTGRELARLRRPNDGLNWHRAGATVTLSQDTVVYIKIVDAFHGNYFGGIIVDDIQIRTIEVPGTGGGGDDEVESLRQQVAQLTAQVDTLLASLRDCNDADAGNQAVIATLTAQLATAQATIVSLNAQISDLTSQLATAQETIVRLNTQVDDLTARNGQLTAQLSSANDRITTLTNANAVLEAENANLRLSNASLTARVDELSALNAQLAGENATLRTENDALNVRVQQLTQQLASLTTQLQTLFNDPGFTIPGSTPEEQMQNLVNAINGLNFGQKQALYKNLGGKP